VLVKTSNPSSGEFQDLNAPSRPIWESVAARVNGWGSDSIGDSGLSSVGAVLGATYPVQARHARRADAGGDDPRARLRHARRHRGRRDRIGARGRHRLHRECEAAA